MSAEDKEGSQGDREGSEREQVPSPVVLNDPYAVLKVERNADDDTIQRSYKRLSRTFHPDKQPPGPAREAAQEVFISFKNAHDILTDPVQRQAFDDHGSLGVEIVRRSIHLREKHPHALYATLSNLHQSGQKEQARLLLKEALQHLDFESHNQNVQFSASMEFPCSTVSTEFLGEGEEPLTVPELQGGHVSFSVTSSRPTPDSKWSVTVGGTTNVMNGKGEGSGQLSLGYKPVQDTHVAIDLEVSNACGVAIGSTRKFSNGTVMTTKMSTMPKTNHLSLFFLSQRALFNNYLGTCVFGMGTDLSVHIYQISCMTLWSDWPQLTAKLRLGDHPLKFSAKQDFGSGRHRHTGHVSCAFSFSSLELRALVDHTLSSYATLSIGIQHATVSGLTWLFAVRHGDVSFRIPINVSSIASPGYSYKLMLLTFLSGLFHSAIRDELGDTAMSNKDDSIEEKTRKRDEASWMELDKSKRDAEQQTNLMMKTAEASREAEKSRNGLVIIKATYWIEGGGSMDATTQLQFWVKNSSLNLPPTPKSHLLGFYSLMAAMDQSKEAQSWWLRFLPRQQVPKERAVPKLTVRYESNDSVYEITVNDDEELVLPNKNAMRIGASGIVK